MSNWIQADQDYVWHPYSAMHSEQPTYPISHANGCMLTLEDGRQLVDGMSSWWCTIHGYNHPVLNQAIQTQLQSMAHVMFGGLTHKPAATLAQKLVELTPEGLQSVFFSDSGSVAVEVALKMAIQYWHSQNFPNKQQFLTVRQGYHGDTFAAMSVCDPITGMHSLFKDSLQRQFFAPAPKTPFGEPLVSDDLTELTQLLEAHHSTIAAVIIEPIVQGAGGMRFYSAEYLSALKQLCEKHQVLLIADEIATGFGRTGKLFACEHASITPDIMTIGKAITGGYMTFAATLTTAHISDSIDQAKPGVFMHGPTFMANPLACATAIASIDLLLSSPWQNNIIRIEQQLKQQLNVCADLACVENVRVLGAIGVVECKHAVNMAVIQDLLVQQGVWIRPFGKLIYLMPPFIISQEELSQLTMAIHAVLKQSVANIFIN